MSEGPLARKVIDALKYVGFASDLAGTGLRFDGSVQVRGQAVALRIIYPDLSFSDPPWVYVTDPIKLGRGVVPHLDEAGELCVVDRRAFVADRYHAAEQALGIVVRAAELLDAGLGTGAADEIAKEFPQHWGGSLIHAEVKGCTGLVDVFTNNEMTWAAVATKPPREGTYGGVVVSTNVRLSFRKDQSRPDTLQEALAWAAAWDPDLPGKITEGLRRLTASDPFCLIQAPNGLIGFQTLVSGVGGPALVKTLNQSGGWSTTLGTPAIQRAPIHRYQGRIVDMDHVLGRSSDDKPLLADKLVVLIGCGSIGGFLAQSIARMGAGSGGQLTLVDSEDLDPTNVGRHVLGLADVGKPKVDGCARRIKEDLPNLDVVAKKLRVQGLKSTVMRSAIVIDATGEQAVGELLNAWCLEVRGAAQTPPDLFHVWIEGQGAAVQSFLSTDPKFACLRCLQPDHGKLPRYPVLRPEAPRDLLGGCGEATFTPYGPAAPMMAAALAARHIADLVTGRPRPLLRVVRLDYEHTYDVRPTNPPKSPACPACGVET